MRTLRMSLAGTVILALLGGLGGAVVAAAQSDETGSTDGLTSEVLFEVVLPVEALPDQLGKMNTLILTVEPGVEATIGIDNEAMRGRAFYLDSGELIIEPMVDALVWRSDETHRGSPTTVEAAEPTQLAPGDLIFLPAVPFEELHPDAVVGITNPGTEPAVMMGFHTHAAGGGFPGWPRGVAAQGVAEHADPASMELVMSGETTFRLSRMTADIGTSVPIAEEALFSMIDVLDGKIERTFSGPGGENARTWFAGSGGIVKLAPDVTIDLMSVGDTPAEVLEVAVMPSAATRSTAAGATGEGTTQAPARAVAISGTATSSWVGLESESIVDDIQQYRGVTIRQVIEADDPRMSGEGMLHGSRDTHPYAGVGLDVDWGTLRIENEDGAWEGVYSGVGVDGVTGETTWFVGEGAYEGLTAFTRAVTAIPDTDGPWQFEGWIYLGDPPSMLGDEAVPVTARLLDDMAIEAWNNDDIGLLTQVYAPEAVHKVVYYDRTELAEGRDAIIDAALGDVTVTRIAPLVELAAPEGELRWIEVVDVTSPSFPGEGTVCSFWARDGLILRQDCVIPHEYPY